MSEIGGVLEGLSISKFGSLRSACEAAGVNYKTLHSQLRNGRKIPFDTVAAISEVLSVSLDTLTSKPTDHIGVAEQNPEDRLAAKSHSKMLRRAHSEMIRHGLSPDCNDILNWLRSTDGELSFDDPVCNYVDLFHRVEVTDGLMRPYKVGPVSLASLWIGIGCNDEYTRKVGQFSRQILDSSLMAHMHVQQTSRYSVEDVTVFGDIDGTNISESYRRVIAPIKDQKGRDFNLVFAELLPKM